MELFDYEQVAMELVRAVRGRRSQRAVSRRLGFRTNVLYTWESGRTFPTASGFLRFANKMGVDAKAALLSLHRVAPDWLLETEDVASPDLVAAFLRDIAGERATVELAKAAHKSRFAMARLLSGEAEPRLPDLLRLVQAGTARLLDFVAAFANPNRLPALSDEWRKLEVSRRLAYEQPMTHAVLRVLELSAYRALPKHEPGFIATRLNITQEDEARYLQSLIESGQVEDRAGRYQSTDVRVVDTRRDPEQAAALRRFWTQVALERAGLRTDDVFAFSLGTVSLRDLERIRELHRRYFTELRAIVGASEPSEAVLLANVQLVRLA